MNTGNTYVLDFMGYWRAVYLYSVPSLPGIFCVYSCTNNVESNSVTLHDLLYIGESSNVRLNIQNHNLYVKWQINLIENQELCFSFATITPSVDENFRKLIKKILVSNNSPKIVEEDNQFSENFFATHSNDFKILTKGSSWKIQQEMYNDSSEFKMISTN